MSRCLFLCLPLLFLLPAQAQLVGQSESEMMSESAAKALTLVLQQPEMRQSKTLYVHVYVSSKSSLAPIKELLSRLLLALPGRVCRLAYQRRLIYKPYVHAQLLLVDDLDALRRIYAQRRATRNLSHTLIYMTQPKADAYQADLQEALQLFWDLSVLNVAVVLAAPAGQLLMVTYYPFSLVHGCQVIRASIINRYVPATGRWASDEFYPKKLSNFYGCTLTCATWEDMPYLVLLPDNSFVGIEGSLLQFMADNLNFTVGMYWLNKAQVLATFNETGWIFEQIFASAADYALGGFHYKPSSDNDVAPFSQSTYYFMSHIMLVANMQSEYSTYERLAFPFHPQLWLVIGLVLALGCLVVWLLRRRRWPQAARFVLGRHNSTPYYNLFVLAAGANLPEQPLPRRNFARFLLGIWLLATLIVRSAYQSGMYRLLRDNTQRNPPQTIAAVLAQHYIIQLIPENVRLLSSLPELRPQQLRELNISELQAFPALASSSGSTERLAIVTPYEYFGYFRKAHVMSRRLHLVRERIFTQQLSFYVRPDSYLVGVLDLQIGYAQIHGFLEHWTSKYVSDVDEADDSVVRITATAYNTVDGTNVDETKAATDAEVAVKLNVLSLAELEGVFWLCLWAHLCALPVFGLELLLGGRQSWRLRRRLRRRRLATAAP